MTPGDLAALRRAEGVEPRVELLLRQWHRVRAVVRVTCGYTPETLKAMSWEEYRQAYADSMYMNKLKNEN